MPNVNFEKIVEEIFNENPACVQSFKLNTAYRKLERFANPSEEVIKKHKEYVRSKR